MECEPTSHGAPSASWGRTQPVLRELKVPTPRMDPIGHTARARTPKKCPKSPRWTVVGSIHHLTITDFRASSPPGGAQAVANGQCNSAAVLPAPHAEAMRAGSRRRHQAPFP